MQPESAGTQIGDLSVADCIARLGKMFEAADVHQVYPLESREVAEVLKSGGAYDVPVDLLENWARTSSVGRVPVRSGKFAWGAENVLAAAGLANSARLWLLDAKHIAKMSGPELAELQARSVGETVFCDLAEVDLRTLIGVISGQNDPTLRSTLCLGLVAKLRADKVIP